MNGDRAWRRTMKHSSPSGPSRTRMTDALGRASTISVLGSCSDELCCPRWSEPGTQRKRTAQQPETKSQVSQSSKAGDVHDKSTERGCADPPEARERDVEPHDRTARLVRNTAQDREHSR